jgi:hypothetical protein
LLSQSRVIVAEIQGRFGNPEKGKRSPLEAVTIRLVKIVVDDNTVCLQ